ncbi:MAG: hypothetical protein OXG84_15515 [Chloroflexi bacterium]|nr:hypothetical protein [Chloroflexota bacterium]
MSELDYSQRYNHIKSLWNNCYHPSIKLLMIDGFLKTILVVLLPVMEHIMILENYKTNGNLLKKANWKEVHRFFFGKSLNDKELRWIIENFYQCIRHAGIQWQTFSGLELGSDPVVFRIICIYDENRIWLINVNEELFIENVVAIIEFYFNDIPLPDGIPNQSYSRIDMKFSETPLEEHPFGT